MTANTHAQTTASASRIREMLGEVEDRAVLEILQLQPSEAEVLQASAWLAMPPAERQPGEFELHGKAALVLRILEQLDEPPQHDRE